MDRGIYAAAAAVETIGRMQETFAHNLANLNTNAYKQKIGFLHDYRAENGSELKTPELGTATMYNQGDIYRTGAPLNVAIDGPGFFMVDAGERGVLYSRDGRLALNTHGDLITLEGHKVVGGTAIMPGGKAGAISSIKIEPDGTVKRDSAPVGKLKLVEFDDEQQLRLVASNLYAKPDSLQPQIFTGQVRQGYLERSNVSAVGELVQMITFSRIYDNSSRVIRTLHETATRQLRQR